MFRFCLISILCCAFAACHAPVPPRVLIFSKTNGYRHQSIEAGKAALLQICSENGIWADTTEDASLFEERNLKRYAAVVFLNTNGDVLNPAQEADFERYIQAGGGYMGVHSAAGTEYTWRWYGQLMGAYFKDHPAVQDVRLQVNDCRHPATRHLDCGGRQWKEEVYNFRRYEPDLHVLLSVADSAYTGGSTPAGAREHALSWCRPFDGGRAFFTALGHLPESYSDPAFRKHLLGGLRYAIGTSLPLRYDRCRTQRLPDQSRFTKTVVASDLAEPMEIALLPDDKILLIERHGRIKLFNPATGLLQTVVKLPVYSEMGDGLLGVEVDPAWEQNHWIYLYYSSLLDSMNVLSRFVFQGDTLDRRSERRMLSIPVGHKDCFHAAGSLCFDAAGYLYLSTGDNTSPFASDGFNPIDERPGRKAFDAQRSSGNTADLRGKILRIKPLPDGTYRCPEDNLFGKKGPMALTEEERERTRPEIYVMGCRNPFRISFDSRRNYLFWGDIGSDAGKADTARGPMGHDEINRAAQAGNFGWPYFTADNQAYRHFDFQNNRSGPWCDPIAPINCSPNNTGLQTLPPAQPALIWYPYGKNRDFPIAGTGGRNAMAGPVFYADEYPAATRFPDYYNGKLIIYDWMRNWFMAVTLDAQGNFYHLEPFADSLSFSRPMDMLFDRKGALWVIEYGTRWYSSNEDARLSRIEYVHGNRPPEARLKVDKTAAGIPATLVFDCSASRDPNGDALHLELDFGDGSRYAFQSRGGKKRSLPTVSHQYALPGAYTARLRATDEQGVVSEQTLSLSIGNEAPVLRWESVAGNSSFYRPGDTLRYRLLVEDREDGSLASGSISPDAVLCNVDFVENGWRRADLDKAGQTVAKPEKYALGKRLVDASDCRHCHAEDRQINGPAFQAIAARYRSNRDFAVPIIYRHIIYGSSGVWGNSTMIPHPQIREEDAIQIALWILSLGDPPKLLPRIPAQGEYVFPPATQENKGAYVLHGEYRDRGANGRPPLSASSVLLLRPYLLQAEQCDKRKPGVEQYSPKGCDGSVLTTLRHGAWFVFKEIDLMGISGLMVRAAYGDGDHPVAGGRLEIRIDGAEGALLGQTDFEARNGSAAEYEERQVNFPGITPNGRHDLYFVCKNEQDVNRGVIGVDWVNFLRR